MFCKFTHPFRKLDIFIKANIFFQENETVYATKRACRLTPKIYFRMAHEVLLTFGKKLQLLGQIFDACRISSRHISVPKSLNVVVNTNITLGN